MVSRRNFFSICVMMVTILILFLFSILIRDVVNNYDVNVYLTDSGLTSEDAWNESLADETTETVVYIGGGDDPAARLVRQWCGYTKRRFVQCGSLAEYAGLEDVSPVLLCLSREGVTTADEANALAILAEAGQNILFSDTPETEVLERLPELRSLLGIREIVSEQVELTGIHLFSGFLLGGDAIYMKADEEEKLDQEIELFAPWYQRMTGTKSYMVGLLEDEEVGNEDLPPLIWRNSFGDGRVFVVNGPYMRDETGLGILSAVLYELRDYELYPVVNAQNLSVVNFPVFALENTEELTEFYARDLYHLQNSLIWPALISASNKGNYKLTNFLTPRLDYSVENDIRMGDLTFYLRQFREQDAETGLSLDHLPGISLADKLATDQAYFDASSSTYSYSAAYIGSGELEAFLALELQGVLKDIHTVTGDWDDADLLFYCTDSVVAQGVTADAFTHSYLQDLRVRAVETALAYNNILLDMRHISWPEEDEPHWEVLADRFSSNINTYWNQFTQFDKTTLSESDERTRAFFTVGYSDARQGDTVTLEITNGNGECWFLLRTHGEAISEMTGGDYMELEEDVYLIQTREKELRIELEALEDRPYFLP